AQAIAAQCVTVQQMAEDLAALAEGADLDRWEQVEPSALAEALLQSFGPLLALNRQRLSVEIAPGLGPLRGDRRRLLHALGNLLENASRHGPEGSTITLRMYRAAEEGTGRLVVLEVEDEGPGIPEGQREAVQAWGVGHGTGLGLSIVREIAERHGGRLRVGQAPGGGARLSLVLPSGGEEASPSE
ncbi:MAG: ATP-binding protein, partial [Deltaproteobacteria bacterium]